MHSNADTTGTPVPRKKASLFTKDFTLVLIGQIISLFGNSIIRFALPLHILYISGSEALFGFVSASAFLPMVVLYPVGGMIADRANKQRIMVVLDFFTAALAAVFLFLSGQVSPVPLFVVTLMMLYGIQGIYTPAVQSSLPFLAKEESLVSANAAVNLVNSLSGLLGPIIGAVLYSRYGLLPIMAIGGVCFFLSAVMELFIRIPYVRQEITGGIWQTAKTDLSVAFRFMSKEKPVLLRALGIVFGINLFMSSLLLIGLPVLITKSLALSTELYGTTQAFLAVGGLLGGLLAGVLGSKLKLENIWMLLGVCGVGMIPMGLSLLLVMPAFGSYLVLTAMSFLLMICSTLASIQMLAFVQKITPGEIVGKVLACVFALSTAAQPIGQSMYGLLFQYWSAIPWVILFGGGLVTLAISIYSRRTFLTVSAAVEA